MSGTRHTGRWVTSGAARSRWTPFGPRQRGPERLL